MVSKKEKRHLKAERKANSGPPKGDRKARYFPARDARKVQDEVECNGKN